MSEDQHHQDRDDTLAEAVRSVAHQLRRISVESLARWEVSPSQSRALRVVTRHGAIRLTELSEHLHIAPRSATEVVDDLQAKGLVERRPDPQDRRATLVVVTEHGIEIGQAIRTAQGAETERLFDRLSATDRDHLARILRKLRA
ncbi:MAG TPA: MarR family transcriptional regulator [Pseudonocardiaceae bacterium]